MLQGILQRAERKVDSVLARYINRATVAVPLVVAGGFATAALTVKLVELYGSVTAYALMAALFAVLSVVTAAVIGAESRAATEASQPAASKDVAEAAADVENMLTPELKAVLATAAPVALPAIARSILRNLPLVLLLAIAAYLFSRFANSSGDLADAAAETAAAG
jgi:Na+-transporting methylmalonyl-CoA/oxaloacetate decarboxylase gamma subunit